MQALEYDKSTGMRKKISENAKRSIRTAKEKMRRARALSAAAALSISGPAALGDSGGLTHAAALANGAAVVESAPGFAAEQSLTGLTSLRTAKDVRERVAAERGESLPAWLTSDRTLPPMASSYSSTPQVVPSNKDSLRDAARVGAAKGGGSARPRPMFILTHSGAPAPLPMPAFPMGPF